MPVASEETNGALKKVIYQETPIMSTYLLAWVIGKFACVETATARGTILRVWAVPERKHECEFPANIARQSLEFYEKFVDAAKLKNEILFVFFCAVILRSIILYRNKI